MEIKLCGTPILLTSQIEKMKTSPTSPFYVTLEVVPQKGTLFQNVPFDITCTLRKQSVGKINVECILTDTAGIKWSRHHRILGELGPGEPNIFTLTVTAKEGGLQEISGIKICDVHDPKNFKEFHNVAQVKIVSQKSGKC